MIQVNLVITSIYFKQQSLFRYLLYWYLWFMTLLNCYIGITSNYVVLININKKRRSLLTSPKCYKASQRSIWFCKRYYVIYSNFRNLFIYIEILSLWRYIRFFNLFLMCHNCRPMYIKFKLNTYILDMGNIINRVVCCLVYYAYYLSLYIFINLYE